MADNQTGAMFHMEIFKGAPALSAFRISKIMTSCHELSLPVTDVYAEFVHFADLNSPLTDSDREVLSKLLVYGPRADKKDTSGDLYLVIPRPGTISPWSSKATDIAKNCGLASIKRLERGIAYYVKSESPLTDEQKKSFIPLIHDRMMEIVTHSMDDAEKLFSKQTPAPMTSIDVLGRGKEALQEAAKRDRQSEYAVASCFHLPVGDGSIDLLLSVFAPYCGDEFLRVLRPGGSFLMVIPLENHLYGLKQVIYEKPYRNEVKPYDLPGFRLEECRELRYQITLHGQEEIESLFMMTPYYYKTGAADQQKLLTKTTLTTPAEFAVLRYKKI